MNFRVDFDIILNNILPNYWRKNRLIDFMQSAFKGLQDINSFDSLDGLKDMANTSSWDSSITYAVGSLVSWENKVYECLVSNSGLTPSANPTEWQANGDTFRGLGPLSEEINYKLQFNGLKIYLEKFLNDQFDNIQTRIYIISNVKFNQRFVYNKVETLSTLNPTYLYNKWNIATTYVAGERVKYGTRIYKAKVGTTGNQPDISPTQWEDEKDPYYIKNKSEFGGDTDYTIYIPAALWAAIDQDNFRAKVNIYNPAGKQYTITTY
jgi:hypothetical protein